LEKLQQTVVSATLALLFKVLKDHIHTVPESKEESPPATIMGKGRTLEELGEAHATPSNNLKKDDEEASEVVCHAWSISIDIFCQVVYYNMILTWPMLESC
jgi:hypothetical protein